jgi:hypothetical protein|tara:strand:+ start:2288 stop:2617 length:330 start_codon:yes stop_codon:yes gene_type:complete
MTNQNISDLPPELQARIAQILQGNQVQPAQEQAPAPKPAPQPSLMDHTIALRQEVAAMNQQVAAMGQVVDAVGQAVGQLYAMFQQQTQPTSYSSAFQAGQTESVDDSDY